MSLSLSVPGKTYLAGEYAVLAGGSAIVLNTGPRFELLARRGRTASEAAGAQGVSEVTRGATGGVASESKISTERVHSEFCKNIPAGSPADFWLKQRSPLLEGWMLEFVDPHHGAGGFGASGAQFILVHAFTTMLQSGFQSTMMAVAEATTNTVEIIHSAAKVETDALSSVITKLDASLMLVEPKDVWQDYQIITKENGSGADILAQIEGNVAKVNMEDKEATSQGWPYRDLGFMILRTGNKIATHEHLQTVKPGFLQPLVPLSREVTKAFGLDLSEEFARKIKSYSNALRELNLQSPKSLALLQPFEEQSWCLAAKGCGAHGADTLLILFRDQSRAEAQSFAQARSLEIIATDRDPQGARTFPAAHIEPGLRVDEKTTETYAH